MEQSVNKKLLALLDSAIMRSTGMGLLPEDLQTILEELKDNGFIDTIKNRAN